MNLFVTNASPSICAENLDDKRVVKQILETAQMLCTALREYDVEHSELLKPTHVNHPVTKWVSISRCNWSWAYDHFLSLCREKRIRWPDKPPHIYEERFSKLLFQLKSNIPKSKFTPFVNCAQRSDMAISCKHIKDTQLAYRIYLCLRWHKDKKEPKWTNRGIPYYKWQTYLLGGCFPKGSYERNFFDGKLKSRK